MELRFTKEQEQLLIKVRHFAETEIITAIAVMESDDEFPSALIKRMAELELMGIPIPVKWGGAGSDFIAYILAINEISKVSAAVGVILSVHTSVGTLPIVQYGTEEQRLNYVSKLASGQFLGAFALTEPHAGSDASAIRTSAVRDGEHYILNGSKVFITNAGAADIYITFAVTDSSMGARGMTAFIINKDTQGFRIGRKEKKMGLHGSNTCELFFEQMRVPINQRLGAEGEGFTIAKGSLDGGRIGIAAQALGIAQAALQMLDQHFKLRSEVQVSKSRRKRSLRDERLADLTAKVEAARLLVYRAAYLRQVGLPCTKEASIAKMMSSDTAVEVTSEAVRLLGADGCSKELLVERLFRDAKVTQIYEGTNEIHRIVISSQLLK